MALDTWDVLKYTSNVSKKLILWESWGQLDCRGWTEAGASVFAAFEVNSKGDIFMFLGGGSTIGSFRNSMRYEPIEQSPVWYMYHWRYALDVPNLQKNPTCLTWGHCERNIFRHNVEQKQEQKQARDDSEKKHLTNNSNQRYRGNYS